MERVGERRRDKDMEGDDMMGGDQLETNLWLTHRSRHPVLNDGRETAGERREESAEREDGACATRIIQRAVNALSLDFPNG